MVSVGLCQHIRKKGVEMGEVQKPCLLGAIL